MTYDIWKGQGKRDRQIQYICLATEQTPPGRGGVGDVGRELDGVQTHIMCRLFLTHVLLISTGIKHFLFTTCTSQVI